MRWSLERDTEPEAAALAKQIRRTLAERVPDRKQASSYLPSNKLQRRAPDASRNEFDQIADTVIIVFRRIFACTVFA